MHQSQSNKIYWGQGLSPQSLFSINTHKENPYPIKPLVNCLDEQGGKTPFTEIAKNNSQISTSSTQGNCSSENNENPQSDQDSDEEGDGDDDVEGFDHKKKEQGKTFIHLKIKMFQ